MLKKLIIILIFISSALSLTCDKISSVQPNDESKSRELTALEKSLTQTTNTFGCNLFRAMVQDQPDSNIFISPLSVSMALGMTTNGAAGTTLEDMRQVLALGNLTEDESNSAYQSIMEFLIGLDPQVHLDIANAIFYRPGYPVLQKFINVNQTYFDAEVSELDFSLPTAIDVINGWVEDNTNGLINEIIQEIDPLTVMFLLNAIYFKADWTYQFEESETEDAQFTTPTGQAPCKMMHQEGDFIYFENEDFQAVDLPYGNNRLSMTIFLPKVTKSVDEIITNLTPQNLAIWTEQLDSTSVTVELPRLLIEYERKLNDVLIAMGMGIAFSGGADFTRIDSNGGIFITMVKHVTFLEVDETGTEAAAVTIVEMGWGIGNNTIKTMRMDRPFLFVIRETESNTILFMGKIVNPES